MVQLSKPRVIIVGGGFGGLTAARALRNTKLSVILIDMNNHHLFQPLLYQVATSALSPGDIANPLRTIFRKDKNIEVIMDEVQKVNLKEKTVTLSDGDLAFDYLILAPGAKQSYFGKPEWAKLAPGLKTLKDALGIRERILLSFEKAERIYNTPNAERFLTFVIVGGGPTGVELAGAIAEIGRRTILPDFPLLKQKDIKIYLVEASKTILSTFPENMIDYAYKSLERLGVNILTGTRVTEVSEDGIKAGDHSINTANIIWAAGNEAPPLLKTLGVQQDKAGRIIVNADLTIPGFPDVFVIGDAAAAPMGDGKLVPGVAQGAIQEAEFAARQILNDKRNKSREKAFKYHDKGTLATIGRAKAVAFFRHSKFKGFFAWLVWAVVHIFFLIGFRNRLRVIIEWLWYYITFQPGALLIVYNKSGGGKIIKKTLPVDNLPSNENVDIHPENR